MNLAEELLLWDGGSSEVTDADAADAKLTGNAIKRGIVSRIGLALRLVAPSEWRKEDLGASFALPAAVCLSRGCCAAMPAPAVLYGAHNGSTWATLSRPSTLLPPE